REVLDWTALQLSKENMQWLRGLPYQVLEGEVTYGHASPRDPQAFEYVFALEQAEDLLARTEKLARLTFIGHSHLQRAFQLGKPVRDVFAERVRVDPNRQYLVSIGSCGSRAITIRGPATGSGTINPGRSSSIGCPTTQSGRPGKSWRRACRRTSRGGCCMGSEMALDFPKHLLELEALTQSQIEGLLSLAARFKRERARARGGEAQTDRRGLLRGRNVITLFFETSTRTRSSFEVAAKALGADVLTFQKDASSVAKGESLEDTVRNLDAIGADALVVRHPAAGAPRLVARAVRASVINAGDGAHEHPTQGLLDALSLRERWGTLEGKTVAIVGDIAHSRVARSN